MHAGAQPSLVRSCSPVAAGLSLVKAHDQADDQGTEDQRTITIAIRQARTGTDGRVGRRQRLGRDSYSPPYLVGRLWCFGGREPVVV
jgi:hypothetical protein